MVKICAHGLCTSDSRKIETGVFFIPFVKATRDREKCERWVAACNRTDFLISNVKKGTYICSKHFVGGKGPSEDYPDPIFETYSHIIPTKAKYKKRRIRNKTAPEEPRVEKNKVISASTLEDTPIVESTEQSLTPENHPLNSLMAIDEENNDEAKELQSFNERKDQENTEPPNHEEPVYSFMVIEDENNVRAKELRSIVAQSDQETESQTNEEPVYSIMVLDENSVRSKELLSRVKLTEQDNQENYQNDGNEEPLYSFVVIKDENDEMCEIFNMETNSKVDVNQNHSSQQSPQTKPSKIFKSLNPIDVKSLYKKAKVPSGWTSAVNDSEVVFLKYPPDSHIISLNINSQGASLKVLGEDINSNHEVYKYLTVSINSELEYKKLLTQLNKWNVCSGNSDEKFLTMYDSKPPDRFKKAKCMYTHHTRSIHHYNCSLLVKGKRCKNCQLLRATLRRSQSYFVKPKPTVPKTNANVRFMTKEQIQERLKARKAHLVLAERKLKRLRRKLLKQKISTGQIEVESDSDSDSEIL